MRKTFLTILLVMLVLVGSAYAEDGKAGYAGAFFNVPIGARPTAMGGAYISVSDDGSGFLYNPAGMANITKPLFVSSYRAMKLDRQMGFAGFLYPAQGNSVIGVSWLYAGDKGLEARDRNGRELGWDIAKNDHSFSVLFAKRFEKFLAAGMKANYLASKIADLSAFAVSVDLGAMVYFSQLFDREKRDQMFVRDIRGGVTVRHLGAKYRWNNEDYILEHTTEVLSTIQEDQVPIEIGVGGSARFLDSKLLLSSDVKFTTESSAFFHGGAEYTPTNETALRLGYSDTRFTAGAGYLFKLGKQMLAIDYAFTTDRADEGNEHIFSFDLLF